MLDPAPQWILTRRLVWPVGIPVTDSAEVRDCQADLPDAGEVLVSVAGDLCDSAPVLITRNRAAETREGAQRNKKREPDMPQLHYQGKIFE
jgi:hypothetical protein